MTAKTKRLGTKKVDPLDVIEAAYWLEGSDAAWLKGILDRFAPSVNEDHGMLAYLYDASARPLRVWNFVGDFQPTTKEIMDVITAADDEYVATSYLVTPFGTASEQPGFDRQVTWNRRLGRYGIRDAICMNAIDTSGIGAWIGGLLPSKRTVDEVDRERWAKVSAHIVAALRLRKRLHSGGNNKRRRASAAVTTPPPPDGIFRTNGVALHVTNDEIALERATLTEAVKQLERARSARRRSSEEAIEAWKVLVRARWSLVDQFERDGKRFVVAYRNAPVSHGPLAFTEREREVVALAMLGHAPKLIAYELGLAASTVRVHLTRASRKLGVRTLSGLITKYRAWLLSQTT